MRAGTPQFEDQVYSRESLISSLWHLYLAIDVAAVYRLLGSALPRNNKPCHSRGITRDHKLTLLGDRVQARQAFDLNIDAIHMHRI